MLDILYTLFIFPIEQIIELSYIFILKVFNNPALSVLGVSFAVSILTLPLYFMAEKHQRSERDIQKKMKPGVDNIRAVFSGDERFMRLAVYYRQNRYHPLYSLRSSISLLIQIPFFIAAYHFLSNLTMIKGVSLGPITDLAKPDSLLVIRNININILPIAMTLINCVSAFIYSKGFFKNEKIQLYGIAAVFLVLLYNSPSGLVLYWTGNNLFSLVKNGIQKTKRPKKTIMILSAFLCSLLVFYLLFFHKGLFVKRIGLAVIIALVPILPFLYSFITKKKIIKLSSETNKENARSTVIFILSLLILFLLAGIVIPSSLISSSVEEFSFIENYKSPFPFVVNASIQSIGIFLLWPLCVYCMFPLNIKRKMAKLTAILVAVSAVNVFLFPGQYGFLTLMFTFSENADSNLTSIFLNCLIIAIVVIFVLVFTDRFRKIMVYGMTILLCAFVLSGIINCKKIYDEFKSFQLRYENDQYLIYEPVYKFSRTGKNILVIMLDKAISGYIPYIFNEKPELYNSFEGFTWYRNAISFGAYTNYGSPGIFGGYEYTPLEIQARKDVPLVEKHNEALLLIPRIFLEQGGGEYVSVTDPPYANYKWVPDLSIFAAYTEIDAKNIRGKYNAQWMKKKQMTVIDVGEIIKSKLIRFSFFKCAPLLLRSVVYDNGKWLMADGDKIGRVSLTMLNNYIDLDVLTDITSVSDIRFNAYNVITNDITHESNFLQFPDYIPINEITDIGNGPFSNEENYHVNVAALLLLGKWFDFLKENGVYDNTRIIIVSDHGRPLNSKFPNDVVLPNGWNLTMLNAFLLVKDFNTYGLLSIDDSFMTNADVPLIALEGIVENPVNPWTGKLLTYDKENGITLTTSTLWRTDKHQRFQFNIKPDEWMHVHDNIFDPANWSMVRK
jgi:membrane protein insertase Oxa1/YidC/SpoIIIJ